ncbi:hypothetical protein ABER75_07580 [Niallia taxi]|nr:hypothetical protein [Niallia taxi]MCM3214911.1 hypothetical protein [Niallia taxi]MDK8638813.1 hypothetical protein [Niallia taxi]MED4037648.1 hypothetical protein [Niallia taxi]MED4053565.1 hypothetical protein [Niallia taxi]MED4119405.1 hypothetical protein [Niallia taxi]
MNGTAILFNEDASIIIIENITDAKQNEEVYACGEMVLLKDDIDWEYGY